MIYYFSATGNSEHAASYLSSLLSEKTRRITHDTVLDKEKDITIVTPLYFWGLPKILSELLEKTQWSEKEKPTFVITCGGFAGSVDRQIKKMVYPATAHIYDVIMETNYIILHTISTKAIISEKLVQADQKIKEIADDFTLHKKTYHSTLVYSLLGTLIQGLHFYEYYRNTKPFQVSASCISCGLCEENCPDKAIRLDQGTPVWIEKKCQNCLRCLHNCPSSAIDYGEKTKGKKRYTYNRYAKVE
ncbi:MAG: EFR1 family ferrodoxin [Gallicola sp.]|nr:EFR1 family ferrodoxin [Gallicola sp.]